mgnify:CR=1 FL=1
MNLMLRTALVGALSLPGAAFAQETINLQTPIVEKQDRTRIEKELFEELKQ